LLFPFTVHDTDFEMVAPISFQDVLLAVWTLLVVGTIGVFLLGLADVVLFDFHVRVESLVDFLDLRCFSLLWLTV
jgi:hypothetical protein